MTEQSKIPLPEGEQGKSLFERAEGTFGGFDGFKPAPVPAELAAPANRRWKKPAAKVAAPVLSPLAGEGGTPSGVEGEGTAAQAAAHAADPSPNPLPQGERAIYPWKRS